MYDGILFDKYGAVIGYNVIRSDGTGRLVPAPSILHIHHPEQVSGARAYSPLQHSINNLIDILEIVSLEERSHEGSG
jgi:capsid protein